MNLGLANVRSNFCIRNVCLLSVCLCVRARLMSMYVCALHVIELIGIYTATRNVEVWKFWQKT